MRFPRVSRDVQGLGQDIINLDFLKPGVDPETVRLSLSGSSRVISI
jgi:hypothetical protein